MLFWTRLTPEDCSNFTITVSNEEEYWLNTGKHCFYPSSNGQVPKIKWNPKRSVGPLDLRLGSRGGSIEFAVFDIASQHNIFAGLEIERIDNKADYCHLSTSTGKDGSLNSLLLPAGQYKVEISDFACEDDTLCVPAKSLTFKFEVSSGIRDKLMLPIDITKIKVSKREMPLP